MAAPRVTFLHAVCLLLVVCLVCGGAVERSFAQAKKAAAAKKPAKTDEDEDKPAPPEDVALDTEDGVKLAVTYYAGMKGKDSIPVVLIHGRKESRKDYLKLAVELQGTLGCTVIVPDLRGHGDSKTTASGKKIDADDRTFGRNYPLMVTQDMKAVKDFLWEKNNAKELNIDKLCMVGADIGALITLNYAAFDSVGYEQGTAKYGPLQLGGFLKAMVLISPLYNFKGLSAKPALDNVVVRGDIPIMFLVGKQSPKALAEATRIRKAMDAYHPTPDADHKDQQTLFFGQLDTSLQGAKLLDEPSLKVSGHIRQFITLRLIKGIDAKTYAWKERKRPHE
ncbi:MAG: alpha/beta fold hydrolase [Thermoguttaceae bacterium]|jgi:pimeloyl-ACP methyl ester carboxylesterase